MNDLSFGIKMWAHVCLVLSIHTFDGRTGGQIAFSWLDHACSMQHAAR